MAEIKVGRKHIALIDDDDYAVISQYRWVVKHIGRNTYAVASRYFALRTWFRMHRLIMNTSPDQIIDHINRNGLDNRRCNLRIATGSINAANGRPQIRNPLNLKGVYHRKTNDKYEVRIRRGKIIIGSKWLVNPVDAALLRDELARILYPEGVYLNYPDKQCPPELAAYARYLINRKVNPPPPRF